MTTLRKPMLLLLSMTQCSLLWMHKARNTLRTWLGLKGLLTASLMASALITSGCSSSYAPLPQVKEPALSVSPQLMEKPNLTQSMLGALS